MRLCILIIFIPMLAFGGDPVSSDRLPYGGSFVDYTGVEGGIPVYSTKHGATMASTSTAAQIQTRINSCPAGNYIEFATGTFTVNARLVIGVNDCALRGQVDANGAPTTTFNFTAGSGGGNGNGLIAFQQSNVRYDLASSHTLEAVVSGFTTAIPPRGSTRVTLGGSVASIAIGQPVIFHTRQGAGGNWSDLFVEDDPPGYAWTQIVRVTAKPGGNDISFEPAINADFLTGTVKVGWIGSGDWITRSGIENIIITRSGSAGGHDIGMLAADECWVKNCKMAGTIGSGEYHMFPDGCYRCEVNHTEITGTDGTNSNSTYCINPSRCSQMLFIDCYIHAIPNIMPMFGLHGSSFSYNYCTDFPYQAGDESWLSQIVFFHGSLNTYNLFEGNWHPANHSDNFGQPGSRNNVYLRNRMLGKDENPTQSVPKTENTKPFFIGSAQLNMSIVGNVLGQDGYHTIYEATADELANDVIYATQGTIGTLQRVGNYNTVNDAIPASEAIGGDTIVDSYLFASKPQFFGALTWPQVDPLSTTLSLAVTTYTNLPAGYRAEFGEDPPAASAVSVSPIKRAINRAGTKALIGL